MAAVSIRIATATQLVVFASMLAALILERVGIPMRRLPAVSMIRCLNAGPQSLALSISRSIFTRALMPYSWLIFVAVINAFALQFTSTVLLTDFDLRFVPKPAKTQNVTIGLHSPNEKDMDENRLPYNGIDYWKAGPVTYNRFAEYSEPASEELDYIDTGRTYRGFLPFHSGFDRYMLRNCKLSPSLIIQIFV